MARKKEKRGSTDEHGDVKVVSGRRAKKRKVTDAAVQNDRFVESPGILKLQISDAIRKVTSAEGNPELAQLLSELKDVLCATSDEPARQVSDRSWLAEDSLDYPLDALPLAAHLSVFQFAPPISVHSDVHRSICESIDPLRLRVDVQIVMPSACLGKRAFLNAAYHHIRAHYLAVCLRRVKRHFTDRLAEVEWVRANGDPLRPCPEFALKRMASTRVRLVGAPEEGAFKLTRFMPSGANVRPAFALADGGGGVSESPPTPHYNASVLADALLVATADRLRGQLTAAPAVCAALRMLRIWLRRRQLYECRGGMSDALLSAWLVYLLRDGQLRSNMTVFDALRTVLSAFVSMDWSATEPTLCEVSADAASSDTPRPTFEQFHHAYKLVFVDYSGYWNLAADLSQLTYRRIVHEAGLAVNMLQLDDAETFSWLVLDEVDFYQSFDHYFHISNVDALKALTVAGKSHLLVDYLADHSGALLDALTDVLAKGLANRVVIIDVDRASSVEHAASLTFGLRFGERWRELVERGPAADGADAAAFRRFWGERAELRKFADSLVCEAVCWPSGDDDDDRSTLPSRVVHHLLELHLEIASSSVRYVGDQFRLALVGRAAKTTAKASAAYEQLAAAMRSLDDLPLSIASVQSTSTVLRQTEPYLAGALICAESLQRSATAAATVLRPTAKRAAPWTQSLAVLLSLESSGKWPKDVDAVARLKAAFYIQIGRLLKQKFGFVTAASVAKCLVIVDGIVFNVSITTDSAVDGEAALVKHSNAIQSLSLAHWSFGATCQLAKRWLSAHLLLDYFAEELVELLVAHIYVHPEPLVRPRSVLTGFARFLKLLASHNWLIAPLIVNFNKSSSSTETEAMTKQFVALRPTLPAMCVCTADDTSGARWTRRGPPSTLLDRAAKLAAAAADQLRLELRRPRGPFPLAKVFATPLDCFDVLIHLDRRRLPRRQHSLEQAEASKDGGGGAQRGAKAPAPLMPVVDFDPVRCYVDELRAAHDDLCMFFHDRYEGDVVGVLLKPRALNRAEFTTSHVLCRSLTAEHRLEVNFEQLLEDFRLIGRGIVRQVEVRSGVAEKLPK